MFLWRLTIDLQFSLVPYQANNNCLIFLPLHNLIVFPREVQCWLSIFGEQGTKHREARGSTTRQFLPLSSRRGLGVNTSRQCTVRHWRRRKQHWVTPGVRRGVGADLPSLLSAGRLWPAWQDEHVPAIYRSHKAEVTLRILCYCSLK